MDNLTHSLFGLTLGRTALGRAGRGTTAALLLASNAPDIDIVTTAGGALKYLEWHRGPTHGPIGVVGLGLVTAALVWGGRRIWDTRSTDAPAPFLMLWAVAIVGVICHVLMDLPTSYGIRLLSPFDGHWFGEDWLPIVDIYLLAALGAGLFFGRGSIPARRRNAALAIGFLLVNYGVRAAAHHQAIVLAPSVFGPLLPERCAEPVVPQTGSGWIDRWPPGDALALPVAAEERDRSARRCLIEIAAMPDFISPFHWRLIARLSNAYEMQNINLLALPTAAETSWRLAVRHPNQWTPMVATASRARTAAVFLGFSRFPTVSSMVDGDGNATVVWGDMRFAMGGTADRRPQRPNIFTVTVRMDRNGQIVEEKLGP